MVKNMTDNEKLTEEKIFDAASIVFQEKGMDGARMQDIANRAGINKALLHYYFRTKDLLFEAVFQKVAGRMLDKFAPVFREDISIEEKIRFFYREHIKFMKENPRLPSFILNEINRHPDRIKKMIRNIDFRRLWETLEKQHKKELEEYNITFESVPQIMVSIASLSVFPFAARGILEEIFDNLHVDFDSFVEERKDFAAEFVLSALKNRTKK
jgi:TetR/AcrR family transcriptional regulator